MSSLKKWRQRVANDPGFDPHMPIYCVPGLLGYVDEFYAGVDFGDLSKIGPFRMPSDMMLIADGEYGIGVARGSREPGWPDSEKWFVTWLDDFGDRTCDTFVSLIVSPDTGRIVSVYCHDEHGNRQGEAEKIVGCVIALHAVVAAQLFRRHREHIQKVVTGNPALGTSPHRGDIYHVRQIEDVLTSYRRLDRREVEMTCGKQRWHMRRGTWVNQGTEREHWRNPHEAGDERIGRIVKDYSLPEYQFGEPQA